MRKLYSTVFAKQAFILFFSITLLLNQGSAQTITTPFTGSFTSFAAPANIAFVVENTNSGDIILTGVNQYCETTENNSVWELYYSSTSLSGSGSPVPGSSWTLIATSTPVPVAANGVVPVFTGLNFIIPASAQYRFVMRNTGPGSTRYILTPSPAGNVFSNGGVNLKVGDAQIAGVNVGYSGNGTTLATTPRWWHGGISFTPAAPCTAPPVSGSATANPSLPVCIGSPVTLGLTGHSTGLSQTYVWQSSSSAAGPFTDITTSSPSANTTVTASASTWYRAAVTCSGNTQFSAPVQVIVNPAFPGGTYNINSGLATGGGNFQTFADAVAAISCGITGPVVFNVQAGSGPYNEQVTIPQIGGTSATKTVTFNGNGETLSFNSTNTNSRAGILLNGADHIIIDSLNINGSAGTYAWGVVLTNQADSNIIRRCTIDIGNVGSSSTNYIGVVLNGSATGTAVSGNNGNGNLFEKNTINGGYYGYYVYGSSSANNSNNKFVNNTIRNNYQYAVYLIYQSRPVVSGNDISRPARTNSTTTAGVYLTTNCTNALIEKNRVHNMFDALASSTSTCYGIYIGGTGTAGQENKVINNLIYNIGGNGAAYGIYNSGSPYMQAWHNTISLDDAIATTGAAYGIYQTSTATGIDLKNNVVSISRSGTGTKRCIYFVTTGSTITSNNNILYMNAASGTNNHLGQFGTTNYTTLADWQTANSGVYDQQSLSLDPQFVSPSTGDYTPGNTLADNKGVNVGVTTDILGNPRSNITPDAGAYEFDFIVAGLNMSAEALVAPAVSATGCYTSNETVTIRIRNNGTATINFATSPVTVTVNVTGAATQTLTVTLNSGTLASNTTMDVALPTTLNMSAAGVYTFNASTGVTGDTNPADNAMPAADRTKEALSAGTATATPGTVCASPSMGATLSTSGQTGYSSFQWQQSATSGSGFTDIPGATTVPYNTSPLTQTTYYRLVAGCGTSTQVSPEATVIFSDPQITSTTPGSRCSPGTVSLGATGTAGTILQWYAAATGGAPIGTGNSFNTPSISGTTTYYVAATTSGVTIITGMPAALSTATSGAGTTDFGLVFDALSPFTLQSVKIYPVAASAGTAGTVTIDVINSSGTVVHTATVNVTGNPVASTVGQTVMLNFNILPGTNYKLRPGSRSSGISGLLFEPSASAPSGNYGYPYVVPGILSIKTSTLTAAPTNTPRNDLYYYFYNWVIGTGCESSRTAVVATITTPELSVQQDTTVCNNAVTALSVSSTLANFDSYVWSPATGLFTDAAATVPYAAGSSATTVYIKSTATGIHKYYINASNSATSCAAIDSVRVTVLPATLSITATRNQICISGSTTLSIPAGEYNNGLQWHSSPDGITYSPIAGATSISYTTPTLTATTYYKLEIKNGAGVVCLQPAITINVSTPQVLTTTNATRCGPGTVTLGATASPGSSLKWYAAATGGTELATGSSFTTPSLAATTTYYVAANSGGTSGVTIPGDGGWNHFSTTGAFQTTLIASAYMILTVSQPFTLNSMDIYPSASVGTAFTIEARTGSASGATFLSYSGATTVTNSGTPTVAQTVPVNWVLPPGTYYIGFVGTNPNTWRTGTVTHSFPWSIPGLVSVDFALTPSYQYYFYNLILSTGCESSRTAVTATVTPGPAFSVARDSLVCNDAITALSVESNVADFDSYTWTPMAGLYTDAAATIPYTGGSATTLYAKLATAGVYKYYINAGNSATTCSGIDSVKLTVLPATLTIAATKTQICGSGSTILSLPAGEYGNASFQWYSSPDGVAYSPIAAATTSAYTTPVLTATTYYKLEIKNGAGAVCLQPVITIAVGTPEIVATAPATRCDPGTVTLGATPGPPGATINWYTAATGGQPIATGTSFTTPSLASTTTYYAAAAFGYTSATAGRPSPVNATSLGASPRGIRFTATQAVKLVSVTVYSTAAAGGSGTIELRNSAGTVIAGPVNVSWAGGGSTANPLPSVLTLNFDVPIGTDHRLLMTTLTGGSITYETSGITGTWPTYTSPGGAIELTASMTSATGTSTTAYYYFYNWQITSGCESPRVAVDAVINGSINIDADPIDRNLCNTGETVVFSVTANGAITDYQWRKNGINIPGATSSTYTIASVSVADAGDYDVIITGPCSTVYSDTATLSFDAPTVVTSDPAAQEVCAGGSVTFTTAATGTGSLGYQWRKDGINIVGAYGSSFTINNVSAADIGSYDVIVTGTCNTDTSNAAALTVAPATTVATQPVAQTVCAGTNVTFTTAGAGAGTLTYQWRKGGVDINGATSANYTITGVAASDAGNYDVVVTGNCGSAVSAIAGLTVRAATTISVQPLAQSICIGSNVTFSVTATGAGTVTYQWRKGGININGATSSSYTINAVTAADIANYDVIVTGDCGAVTSNAAALTISAPGTWIGVQNTDWNNAANWCGAIPTSATDVVISASAPNMPILSNAGFARNITIQSGATVTVAAGGVLNLYGNITGSGLFTPTAGSIAFRSTTPQSVPAFTATNVTMNGAGGFTLAGNTVITGTLTLTNGNITLGSNNLRLAAGSTGSANSHIITNGSGAVIVAGLAASSTRIIPVGISASSYTPVILAANAGHVTDDLSVRVREHVLANGTTGTQLTRFVVDRTWLIDEAVPGGSNVNLTVQWNESDELQDFGRNESYVMQYTGGAWVPGTETFANGANPYTQTKTNVTSFSAFAVQTDPLPIVSAGIFPNPVRTILNVVVRTNAPERLTISVFDPTGKLVKRQVEAVGYGGTLLDVDVTGLMAGTYILKISIAKDRELLVKKFIKMN